MSVLKALLELGKHLHEDATLLVDEDTFHLLRVKVEALNPRPMSVMHVMNPLVAQESGMPEVRVHTAGGVLTVRRSK